MINDRLLASRSLDEMSDLERERIFEALVFASKEPIQKKDLIEMFGSESEVSRLIDSLKKFYHGRGIEVFATKKSIAFRTSSEIKHLVNFPIIERKKLSKAAVETLAIIAYYQPVTRLEIEKIRGVSISRGTLDILIEEGWIALGRRKSSPGRPGTFITTEIFLDHFGLESIKELPGLEELKEAGFGKLDLSLGQ